MDRFEYARKVDPTQILESRGFKIKKDSQRDWKLYRGNEEKHSYRVSWRGSWVYCDHLARGIGKSSSSIDFLLHIDGLPNDKFGLNKAVDILTSSQPSLPAVRKEPESKVRRPTKPTRKMIELGRQYLNSRGISEEVSIEAEKQNFLSYSDYRVLFFGYNELNELRFINERGYGAGHGKKDRKGSKKKYCPILRGQNPSTVLIVEGCIDALAVHEKAKREGRSTPTVIATTSINNKAFLTSPVVKEVLKEASKIVVVGENDNTDHLHQVQLKLVRDTCGGEVYSWRPPKEFKDFAAWVEST